jgi:hypothetical protein
VPEATFTFRLEGAAPNDAQAIYHQGQAFFLAGNRCLLNIEIGPGVTQCLVSPGVVNLCLAAELFMKALVQVRGATPEKTHRLTDLFAAIPRDDQDAVRGYYSSCVQEPELDALLDQVGEYFVKVRYGHEFEIFTFAEFPITIFAKALYLRSAEKFEQPRMPPMRL